MVGATFPKTFSAPFLRRNGIRITPDLRGAESTRNLWPEPYLKRWNACLKDTLEQKLHQLVYAGKVDLATAQRDIATDWTAAYRQYVSPR